MARETSCHPGNAVTLCFPSLGLLPARGIHILRVGNSVAGHRSPGRCQSDVPWRPGIPCLPGPLFPPHSRRFGKLRRSCLSPRSSASSTSMFRYVPKQFVLCLSCFHPEILGLIVERLIFVFGDHACSLPQRGDCIGISRRRFLKHVE